MPKTRRAYGKVALKPKRDSNNLQTDDDAAFLHVDSFRSKGRTQDASNVKKSMKRGYEPSTESVSLTSSMLQAVHSSIVKPRKSDSKNNANQNSRRRKSALRDSTNIKKKSIGDEITPKISNRNKGNDRQHPAGDVETLLQPNVFSPTIHSDGKNSTIKQFDDASSMDCGSSDSSLLDSGGKESPTDESKIGTDEKPRDSTILRKGGIASKSVDTSTYTMVDSNGCPIVTKKLMEQAQNSKPDNQHVLQVLMSSCNGGKNQTDNESNASSSIHSDMTLRSATIIGANIPLKRHDSKDSALTMPAGLGELEDCAQTKHSKDKVLSWNKTTHTNNNSILFRDDQSIITYVQTRDENVGATITHPRLPPGYQVRVSRSKGKVYYVHPEREASWFCPVLIDNDVEIVFDKSPAVSKNFVGNRVAIDSKQSNDDGNVESNRTFPVETKNIDQVSRGGANHKLDMGKYETVAVHKHGSKPEFTIYEDPIENMHVEEEPSVSTRVAVDALVQMSTSSSNHTKSIRVNCPDQIKMKQSEFTVETRGSEMSDTVNDNPSDEKQSFDFSQGHEQGDEKSVEAFSIDHSNGCEGNESNGFQYDEAIENLSDNEGIESDSSKEGVCESSQNLLESSSISATKTAQSKSSRATSASFGSNANGLDSLSGSEIFTSEQSSISNIQNSPRYLDFESNGERSSLSKIPSFSSRASSSNYGNASSESRFDLHSESSSMSSLNANVDNHLSQCRNLTAHTKNHRRALYDRLRKMTDPICSLQRLDEIAAQLRKKKGKKRRRNYASVPRGKRSKM